MPSATALAHSHLNSGLQFFSKPKIAAKKKRKIILYGKEIDRSLFLTMVGDYHWTQINKPVKSLRYLSVHMKQLEHS